MEIATVLQVIDKRLTRIERAFADPKPESIDGGRAYSRRQAARALGVSTWTIDKARKEGLLVEARRIGQRDVRITGASLSEFFKQRETTSVRVRRM